MVRPARIIEIGTGGGGFSYYLRDTLAVLQLRNCRILSYSLEELPAFETLRSSGIEVVIQDVMGKEASRDLGATIGDLGLTLLLCDGGNKIEEFRRFSASLKKGDYIMVHDFAPTADYFRDFIKNHTWNWLEITSDDVSDEIRLQELVPKHGNLFTGISWGCFQKQL